MKWFRRLAGTVLAIGLVGYFLWFARRNLDLDVLAQVFQQPMTIAALGVATLCYMALYPITGLAWRQLLLRQGQSWRSPHLIQLLGVTQLAKYIPGNIAQHASRAALALKRGMPLQSYVASTLQETLLAVAASVIVGSTMLALASSPANLAQHQWALYLLISISLAGIALFCIDLPPSRLRSFEGRAWRMLRMIGGLPGSATTLKALTGYVINYLMIGLGIWIIALSLGMTDDIDYPLAVAAFALSWTLGFLAPGAPAGLGAREGIMTLLLQGHGSNEQVVLLTLLTRVASMSGDLLTFAIAAACTGAADKNESTK